MNRAILRLALPAIISNITVPLLGLIDLTIVGHMGDKAYIAAIAVGSMIFNVMYWLMGFLRMGTSGMTAQAIGRKDHGEAIRLYRKALLTGLAIGVTFIILTVPLRYIALLLMQVSAETSDIVSTYFNICIWGAPAMLATYGLTGWFIGMQNTRIPMIVAITQNVMNIILSLTLVYGFHQGIEGVAFGTMLSQWYAFIASWLLSLRLRQGLLIQPAVVFQSSSDKKEEKSFRSVNTQIFLRTICLVSVNLFFTSAGSAQGTLMLAVNTLLMTLFTIFSYFMDGIAYAGEALGGKYYGAGDIGRQRQLTATLMAWGVVLAFIFTIFYAIGGNAFLSLITNDTTVINATAPFMIYALLVPTVSFMAFIFDGLFIGMTMTRQMLLSCGIATALFFASFILLEPHFCNSALWIAYLLFLFTRGFIQAFIIAPMLRINEHLVNNYRT